jgi:hypothetical protein
MELKNGNWKGKEIIQTKFVGQIWMNVGIVRIHTYN